MDRGAPRCHQGFRTDKIILYVGYKNTYSLYKCKILMYSTKLKTKLHTMKLGPVEMFWHNFNSFIQSSSVMWSAVASSRTPHLMSTTWKSYPVDWQYSFSLGYTRAISAFRSCIESCQRSKNNSSFSKYIFKTTKNWLFSWTEFEKIIFWNY